MAHDVGSARTARRPGRRLLLVVVLLLVVGQRLALPAGSGQVSVTMLGLLGVSAIGLVQGSLLVDGTRARLLGLALVAVAVATIVAVLRGSEISMFSLVLFVLIYLPATLRAVDAEAALDALRFFVDLMVFLAGAGLVLFVLQFVGITYVDYVAKIVPEAFLQQGYNTSYPLTYGSGTYRSNGVVFLEASFFSFFLAVAVLVSIHLSHRRRWLPLLLAALVATASGNGMVVLLAGLATMLLVRSERRKLWGLLAPLVLAAVLLVVTPLGALLVSRVAELNTPDSSGSLRVVAPYQVLVPPVVASPIATLAGNGAGSAQRYYEAHVLDAYGMPPILAAPGPKLLFEFGLLGGVPVLLFLGYVLGRDGWRLPWAPGILLAFFVLNASLQQPVIAAVSYVMLSMLSGGARLAGTAVGASPEQDGEPTTAGPAVPATRPGMGVR